MASVITRPEAPAPTPPPPRLAARRSTVADRGFQYLALGCGLLVLVILALIAYASITKAWPAFRTEGLTFFTSKVWDPNNNKFGALAFAYGTVVTSVIALVVGVPVSIGIALVLTEVAPHWTRKPVIYVIDLLAAVPSVVFGLWGLLVLRKPLDNRYGDLNNWFKHIPVLNTLFGGGQHQGTSLMTAGLILAIMITPIVTSLSR